MNKIPNMVSNLGTRMISNARFPKISHLPSSDRATQASGACFDPEKIKTASNRLAQTETSAHLNIKPVK